MQKEHSSMNAGKKKRFQRGARLSTDRVVFNIVGYPMIAIFALFCLLPFWLVVSGSFTSQQEIITHGYGLFPRNPTLESYAMSLKNPGAIANAYLVNIFITVVGTVSSVFICAMTGYVLTRNDFPWRFGFSLFFFFTTLFNGGLVPTYMLINTSLGLENNLLALILPAIVSVWNILLCKGFMKSLPYSITESAKIDGAGDFLIFVRLILPISMPVIATIGLFTALGFWNEWYRAMLYIRSASLRPLQYFLQQLITTQQAIRAMMQESGEYVPSVPVESMRMSLTVIVTGPIILLYPFLQRFFIRGLTVGSVKG
jgi:putative aldouronate transport system permease protein